MCPHPPCPPNLTPGSLQLCSATKLYFYKSQPGVSAKPPGDKQTALLRGDLERQISALDVFSKRFCIACWKMLRFVTMLRRVLGGSPRSILYESVKTSGRFTHIHSEGYHRTDSSPSNFPSGRQLPAEFSQLGLLWSKVVILFFFFPIFWSSLCPGAPAL